MTGGHAAFTEIITQDRALFAIFRYLEVVAPSPQPVLITGETGTGKELIARALHRLSQRPGELVAVNVAGLDDTLFSDTLFGHARGAYTGADRPREGLVAGAAGGTLFLDEIGDLTVPSQVKLLRLLQDGAYYPLGADRSRQSRARIVVATNCDVAQAVAAGAFRKDLYYRLRTHQLQLPPLRRRTARATCRCSSTTSSTGRPARSGKRRRHSRTRSTAVRSGRAFPLARAEPLRPLSLRCCSSLKAVGIDSNTRLPPLAMAPHVAVGAATRAHSAYACVVDEAVSRWGRNRRCRGQAKPRGRGGPLAGIYPARRAAWSSPAAVLRND